MNETDSHLATRMQDHLAAAIESYRTCLRLDPDNPETLLLLGKALAMQQETAEALSCYNRLVARGTPRPEILVQRAALLFQHGDTNRALADYERALRLDGNFVEALIRRAVIFRRHGRLDDAVKGCSKVLALEPGHVEALCERACALQALDRHEEVLQDCKTLAAIEPDHELLAAGILLSGTQICDWTTVEENAPRFARDIARGKQVPPLALMGVSDDPALLTDCATGFFRTAMKTVPVEANPAIGSEGKLRIGYVSGDFCSHATASLITSVLERQDRAQFQLIAFSHSPREDSIARRRLAAAFDKFYEIGHLTDHEVASLMRQNSIDIAVDLKGYTLGSRLSLFAQRVAPVQVSWLGYPGSLGVAFMDYIIADKVVLPHENQRYFNEQIVHMPHSYQPNDPARAVGKAPSRRQAGLPDDGFVYCCFNGHWKITRPIFDAWMRLLTALPQSVLWLIDDRASGTLRAEATARGVDPARLVFAPRLPEAEHLARIGCADLMLDTAPCNAHTTASDALWAGLPLVTFMGRAFHSRVAASLVHALKLEEMVAGDLAGYEALALALARDPARLADMRSRLLAARKTEPLFNADMFARHLDSAYLHMATAARRGERPMPFDVSP